MKKKIVVIIITVILFLFFARGWASDLFPNTFLNTNKTSLIPSGQEDQSGSIQTLMTSGKSLKCTLHSDLPSGTVDGTIYVSQNKSKTEITTKPNDSNVAIAYTIIDGDWGYSWTNFGSIGFKVKLGSQNQNDFQSDQAFSGINQQYKFKCQNWNPDSNFFVLPKDIKFNDVNQVNTAPVQSVKDICHLLPEPQKSQCLQAPR